MSTPVTSALPAEIDSRRPEIAEICARFGPLEQYFGLKEQLEGLFERPVDLLEAGASSNRYFLESVNKSRRLLYAA